MNIKDFDKKYKDKGGSQMLNRMRADLLPQKVISHHFKVSQERVRQWMMEMYKEKYDPRLERKEIALQKMVKFYENTSLYQFKKAFRGTAYYREALKLIEK